jgi:acetyl-CoA carboxylase biotin carboxyl carrier protein
MGIFRPKSAKNHLLSHVDFITLASCRKAGLPDTSGNQLAKPKPFTKLKNMDFKQIQELVKMINKSNIGELTVEQKDFRVTIKQKEEHVTQVASAGLVHQVPVYQNAPQPATQNMQPATTGSEKPKEVETVPTNTITIKSPMIGTFYRKTSPDKPNLVDVGTDIIPGKIVCIIEAMKLFNEIESEVKGKIVKVLVEDASPVEYDQPLFIVEPV